MKTALHLRDYEEILNQVKQKINTSFLIGRYQLHFHIISISKQMVQK